MLKAVRNFFNGLAFGITETVPGISGGTIAIILGFYFDLIRAINNFTREPKKSLRLLLPVALGAAAGIVLFSSVMEFLLRKYSFPAMMLFIGLISGIIPHIFSRAKAGEKRLGIREILLALAPFPVLFAVNFLGGEPAAQPAQIVDTIGIGYMLFIFFAGIIAAMALVIPGTSGSFILLVLGIYPVVIHSVSSVRLLFAGADPALAADIAKVLVPLALGVITGGLSMARLIERLLKNHERTVFSLILGLLCASVIVLLLQPMVYVSGMSAPFVIAGIITFAAGCTASFRLWKKGI
jgi:putative membrane protein